MTSRVRFVIQWRVLLRGCWRRWQHDPRQTLNGWECAAYAAQCPRDGEWCYFGSGKLQMRVKAYRRSGE
jgi:hypothetical protein